MVYFKTRDVHNHEKKLCAALPKKEFLILGGIQTGSAIQYGLLATLLVYVVQWHGIAKEPREIGLYTGILVSMPAFGQLITSMIWGFLSDRFGRKPWMFMALCATATTCFLLGIIKSYFFACIALGCYGIMHCTILMTKAMMADCCNEKDQANGFSVLVFCWGVGTILGPIGGILAQPNTKWNIPSPLSSLFASLPFFLSFSVPALYHVGTIISLFWMPETNSVKEKGNDKLPFTCGYKKIPHKAGSRKISIPDSSLEDGLLSPSQNEPESFNFGEKKGPLSSEAILVTIMYGCLNFVQVYSDTLLSIFAAAPEEVGGLQFDSSTMGFINSIYGCIILVHMVFVFPSLGKKIGALNCTKLGFLLYIPLWISIPFCAWFNSKPLVKLTLLAGFKAVRAVAGSTAYTGAMMVVSNAASSSNLGLVTGLGETIAGILMSVAPTLAGGLWTQLSASKFAFAAFVPWTVPSVLSIFMVFLICSLPKSLNKRQVS